MSTESPSHVPLTPETVERLNRQAQDRDLEASDLVQRYIEEGLRRDEHPLIRFSDGPAGRRAGLTGSGLDVWEIIATLRDNNGDLEASANYLSLSLRTARAAVAYYEEHSDEIDELISDNEQAATQAQATWESSRALDDSR